MADTDHITTPGKSPAFQFYPGDFLHDGNQSSMSLQECGAYIRLLCVCWRDGSIPDDAVRVARMVGTTTAQMRKLWPAVRACFKAGDEGRLIHGRLERERQKQADYKRRQGDASRKRWESRGNATALPTDMPPHIPKPSSSDLQSSNLQSSDFSQSATRSPRAVQGGGLMAGTLPRDHLNCRQPCVRVCVSQKQHALLVARHGGDDAALDVFYADVRRHLSPSVPIGDSPWKFWDAQFAAKFGSAVPAANGKTAGNLGNLQRFAARGKA